MPQLLGTSRGPTAGWEEVSPCEPLRLGPTAGTGRGGAPLRTVPHGGPWAGGRRPVCTFGVFNFNVNGHRLDRTEPGSGHVGPLTLAAAVKRWAWASPEHGGNLIYYQPPAVMRPGP